MASMRRSWKLQNFVAHNENVNCLALGHKSGRVMVTGGDDKKVNLWAVGKQSCFMSLSGHITPIDCVEFNQLEELVCAGSRAGAMKVWDLEAAKLVRTLSGHKYAVKCIDFHPYGHLLASGSADTSIKLWDTRKKGVLYTFNGHRGTVNSARFSPDGQWIASGGEDATIKIWDLRVGRVLKEFQNHTSAVTSVEFHPHEFLLASGGADSKVHLFDLENFNLVSSETDVGNVRCLCFNPDGDCLFAGTRDYLKIIGWEPSTLYDTVPVFWGRVGDISTASNQLIGASFKLTEVQIYVVDLNKCKPWNDSPVNHAVNNTTTTTTTSSPFAHNQSLRKSFSKADRPPSLKTRHPDVKTIEESTSGTDPEEDSFAHITHIGDYTEIFGGRGLARTPPPEPEPFQEPERDYARSPPRVQELYQEPERDYSVLRTGSPAQELYQEPERDNHDPTKPQILGGLLGTDGFEALSLDNNISNYKNLPSPAQYSRSRSNLDQVYTSRLTNNSDNTNNNRDSTLSKSRTTNNFSLQRQSSCKNVTEKRGTTGGGVTGGRVSTSIKHSVSEANVSKAGASSKNNISRKNSFSKPARNVNVSTNVTKTHNSINSARVPAARSLPTSTPRIYIAPPPTLNDTTSTSHTPEEEFVPAPIDKPVGLDLDDFLPRDHNTLGFQQHLPDMSEAEVLGVLMRGHQPMASILSRRQKSHKIVLTQVETRDLKTAFDTALRLSDEAIVNDVLCVINEKFSLWNLDLCVIVLPKILDLLQSKYETYVKTGCNTTKLILKHFAPVIRTNVQAPVGSFGVDIPREERYNKSVKCHEMLCQIRTFISKKQTLPGAPFKEIYQLMQNCLD